MKLLLIDRDRDLVEMLSGWLKTRGYTVQRAYTLEQAEAMWREQKPDLVLVDTAHPDADLLKLCRELRIEHDALVIVMTASKDVQNEIASLEAGADDYLRKPFFPAQLIARLQALSRRTRSTLHPGPSSRVTVGPICIDVLQRQAIVRGNAIRLTSMESKLLHLLALNANDVCTADQIVSWVWGYDESGSTELIKTHIRHLRQKIEPDPGRPSYIRTIPGVGYTLIRPSLEEQEHIADESSLRQAVS